MSPWQLGKLWAVDALGLAKDALHVHVGLLLMLGAAALLRLRLRDPRLVALVLLAALLGEAWDVWDTVRYDGEAPRWAGSAKDVANTLFWPAMLWLLARYTKVLAR